MNINAPQQRQIIELEQERQRLAAEQDDLIARNGDDPSTWDEGQATRAENIMRGIDRIDDKLLVLRAERERYVERIRGVVANPANLERTIPEPPGGSALGIRGKGDPERDAAARTIDAAHRSGLLPDHGAERATSLLETGSLGERSLAARWAAATGDEHYLRAFAKLCADPDKGHLLWDTREHAAYQAVAEVQTFMRGMSLTDSAGGYMVPLHLDPAIVLSNAGTTNAVRQVARVVQTTSESWQGVTSAGVTAEWKAEAAQAADGTPTLAGVPIPVHMGSAYVPFSYEVGMDALNFTEELQKVLVDAAVRISATAYTTGSGTGQPTGVVKALDGGTSEVAVTSAETFAAADVYKLIEALPPRFRPNATWMANLTVLDLIDQFETTNGAKKFPQVGADPSILLRRPVLENSDMDGAWNTAATADNFILLVGDFKEYVVVDRIGAQLDLIPHVFGANGRPTGERGAHLWFRTGGNVSTIEAFRVLNLATTA